LKIPICKFLLLNEKIVQEYKYFNGVCYVIELICLLLLIVFLLFVLFYRKTFNFSFYSMEKISKI